MPDPTDELRPATSDELEQALSHALRFDGRKAFKVSGDPMARITAAHLAEHLRISGFVVMRRPPGKASSVSYDGMTGRLKE